MEASIILTKEDIKKAFVRAHDEFLSYLDERINLNKRTSCMILRAAFFVALSLSFLAAPLHGKLPCSYGIPLPAPSVNDRVVFS